STYALKPGSSISGAGTTTFSLGTTNLGGQYSLTGGTVVAGGTANFMSPVTNVGALIVAPGTANFSSGSPITVSSLTMEEGTLTGSDNLTISGAFQWISGTMSGTGSTLIQSGAQLQLMGDGSEMRALTNKGSVSAFPGSVLTLAPGAVVTNAGTWNDE